MTYKNRLICLLSIIGVLTLLYVLSFIFNYDMGSRRSSSYAWLDPKAAEKTTKIVISAEDQAPFEIIKKNDKWFTIYNNYEYPVRNARVEDLLSIFTKRSSWHVRSSSASSHERFGLGDNAFRITIYGEYGNILDILLGDDDIMGREAYFRKVGQNEVRQGDNSIKSFLSGSILSWYNLRLIPESEGGNIDMKSVQRLTVSTENETQIFTRRNRGWDIAGINVDNPDYSAIETHINFILNMEGEDFIGASEVSDFDFSKNRVTLEFGNGAVITISVTEPDEVNKRYAQVSNNNYSYVIPLWVSMRIFRNAESFEIK